MEILRISQSYLTINQSDKNSTRLIDPHKNIRNGYVKTKLLFLDQIRAEDAYYIRGVTEKIAMVRFIFGLAV